LTPVAIKIIADLPLKELIENLLKYTFDSRQVVLISHLIHSENMSLSIKPAPRILSAQWKMSSYDVCNQENRTLMFFNPRRAPLERLED
jgi:hypothetical protein